MRRYWYCERCGSNLIRLYHLSMRETDVRCPRCQEVVRRLSDREVADLSTNEREALWRLPLDADE